MDNREASRERQISRVTIWGGVGNLLLTAFKIVAGLAGQSSAMVADAIHSLSDLVSDVVVLLLVRVSGKGVDEDHGYGHGKYETLATALVSLLLLLVGGELMISGVEKIKTVVGGGELEVPGGVALLAALVSIVVKEVLYQWTARVGRRVNSQAVVSNAWHHRTDALSSIGSAVGIGGAMLLGGDWAILDPLVGCVISVFIVVVAIKMGMPAFDELTERSLPSEVERRVVELIESVDGVESVHCLKTRRNGPILIISAHVVVDPDMTVAEAHHKTVLAENAVRSELGPEILISIHVEPDEEAE